MNNLMLTYMLLMLIVTSLQDECNAPITDTNNREVNIDTECSEKSCLIKCCGLDEVLYINHSYVCKNIEELQNEHPTINWTVIQLADYSQMKIYQKDVHKELLISSKTFHDFTILQSMSFKPNTTSKCAIFGEPQETFILETGILAQESPHLYDYWTPYDTSSFCVDKYVATKQINGTDHIKSQFVIKLITADETVSDSKGIFVAISYTISAFFLLLVLIVYSVLHQLRNIQGMLLVAYVSTLLLMQTIKAGYLYYVYSKNNDDRGDCTHITEIIYFLILASFFWLKIMSFDIWWTFRGTLKHRPIHRRGIKVKFLIYAAYAYGAAAAMTVFAVVMDDQKDNLPPRVVVPFFNTCMISRSFIYYLFVPLIILTATNCLLFVMTIYNIHLLGKEIASFDKNTMSNNNKNKHTFWLYMRLSLLMGVSWILEFAQVWIDENDTPLWVFVLVNMYNVLTGVVIFFLFVFKTNIFVMLAKRFSIENRWTRRLQATTTSERTETSKSGKSYSRSCSKTTDSDMEDGAFIDAHPNGEGGVELKTYELNGKLDTRV